MVVAGRRGRRVSSPRVLVTVALLVLALVLSSGCSDSPPPTDTLASLATAVGDGQPDTIDFDALLEQFASQGYQVTGQSEQANYQLFLTAKAAQAGLPAGTSEGLEVEEDVSGDDATVVFKVLSRDGVFSVADVSSITVGFVKGEDEQHPWRIDSIVLAR